MLYLLRFAVYFGKKAFMNVKVYMGGSATSWTAQKAPEKNFTAEEGLICPS